MPGFEQINRDLLQACEWMEEFILACNENRVTQEHVDLYESMMKLARDSIVKARAAPSESAKS